jgi:hypothetical protein
MTDIVELLESELEEAFEVKDRKSLHRYVVLMVDRFASRSAAEHQNQRFDEILAAMREGFQRMDERFAAVDKRFEAMQQQIDQRFEAVDKRFDDMNKRFTMLVTLMSIFFTLLAGMITAFGVLG